MTIKVDYIAPPVPSRNFDFRAYIQGTEPDGPRGFGPTVSAALRELADELDSEPENLPPHSGH